MKNLILFALSNPARFIRRYLFQPNFRQYVKEYIRLSKYDRFEPFRAHVERFYIEGPDKASYLSALYEIFIDEIYDVPFEKSNPVILDCGANIGLGTLYIKGKYSNARVVALEPDERIFMFLEKNIHRACLTDVELIRKAVWSNKTRLFFSADGADGGRVSDQSGLGVAVDAEDIAELIEKYRPDFIKMDIEGAEDVVLPRCRGHLADVKFMFIEYHSHKNRRQNLHLILEILQESGFRVNVENPSGRKRGFQDIPDGREFDLQLNIYATNHSSSPMKRSI